jgi:hypothetical protein
MLGRTTFRINRLLGFGSPKQLIAQANDREDQRPLVALIELVVDVVDPAKDAGVALVPTVTVDDDSVEVSDSGSRAIKLIQTRLTKIGITKVAPGPDVLASAYRRAGRTGIVNRALAAAADDARRQAAEIDLPVDLVDRVRAYLEEHPEEAWGGAIARLVEGVLPGAGSDHGPSRLSPPFRPTADGACAMISVGLNSDDLS